MNYSEFVNLLPNISPHSTVSSDYLNSLSVRKLSLDERDAVLQILDRLFDNPHQAAGKHRLQQWDTGWTENLKLLETSRDLSSLVPGYYNKYPFIRLGGDLFHSLTPDTENNSVRMLMHYIYERFLCDSQSICELGCGTGHHLIQLAQIDSRKDYHGFDWATSSQAILKLVQSIEPSFSLFGHRLDFFDPFSSCGSIPKGSAIFTFAALEQIGCNHTHIIDYLISAQPSIVIHLEPISELLNSSNLLHFLSIKYFQKRNYLSGFLTALQHQSSEGNIDILHAEPTGVGSMFIEGYSMVVWKPRAI